MPGDEVRALLPALRAAWEWLRGAGDPDGDGFCEYRGSDGAGLAEPDLDSGYGLRTLSARTGGFNPLSYHRGSV